MACWILSALLCAAVGADADCAIVHFTAAGCEPCKQIEPALAQLQREGWVVHTVDVERQPELVQQFRVQNLPTLAILCRQQEVDRMVGAAPYERIHERVVRAAARNQSGHAPAAQTEVNTGPIVRGQSPGIAAFPMLATAGSFSAQQPLAPAADHDHQSHDHQTSAPQPITPATTLTVEQAMARAAAATVRIRVDEANTTAYGTGTIVDVRGQEALILTCGHLFREMQPHSQLTIDLFPGTPQEVNLPSELIDFKAEGEDIGLISFRLPTPVEPVPILARGEPVAVGQPAFSYGCDHGANPTRRDTQIKSINRYLGADNIEIVGAPVLGRSGGGLFDNQGRLIGVCNAANPADDEGIYAANNVVYSQIERLGLSELFEGSQPSAATAPPVQLASASTNSNPAGGWQQPAAATATFATHGVRPTSGSPELQWPDQTATVPSLETSLEAALETPQSGLSSLANAGSTGTTAGGGGSATASQTRQIICIVREAGGQDKVLTIDAPPEQLLQMIQQSSRR